MQCTKIRDFPEARLCRGRGGGGDGSSPSHGPLENRHGSTGLQTGCQFVKYVLHLLTLQRQLLVTPNFIFCHAGLDPASSSPPMTMEPK